MRVYGIIFSFYLFILILIILFLFVRDGAVIVAWLGQEALGVRLTGPPINIKVII